MSLPLRTRAFCALVDALSGPPLAEKSLAQIRRNRALQPVHTPPLDRIFGRVPADVSWRDTLATTRAGAVRLRVYRSARTRPGAPLLLWFHGGGWVQGGLRGYDAVCGQLASRVGAVVVSVDYRLAPEHRFPAAVEDCLDATRWVVENADRWAADPTRVAVAGDSAGGNLAAVVALAVRDGGGPALACQVLVYPGLDGTLSSGSVDEHAHAPILTRRKIREFLDCYHPGADRTDPRLSPMLAADLAGLPRTLIQTAAHDPLRDDGVRYAAALRSAGVAVRYTEYVDVPHGYLSFPGVAACGLQPLAEIAAELSGAFGSEVLG